MQSLVDRAGRHDIAHRALQPMLTTCIPWLDARAGATDRDIVITQDHLRRFDECLATLEPLQADAERSAADLDRAYRGLPADVAWANEQADAIRTDLRLCRSNGRTS